MKKINVLFTVMLIGMFVLANGCSNDSGSSTTHKSDGDSEVDIDLVETDSSESIEDLDSEQAEEFQEETDEELVCEPNSRKCMGNSVLICNHDGTGYMPPEECEENQFCRDGACIDQVCEPASAVCVDMFSYKVCNEEGSGFDDPISCGEGKYCRFGVCNDQVCEPNTVQCVGNGYATCLEDGSGFGEITSCSENQYCEDGECKDKACQPGSWTCEDSKTHKQCNDTGSGWNNPVACAQNEYCEDGECKQFACIPNESKCEGNAIVTCNEIGSAWGDPEECPENTECVGASCVSRICTPGESICSGNYVITCLDSGNGYGEPVACGENQFCADGQCHDQICTPTSRQCDEDGNVVVCNDTGSAWGPPTPCDEGRICVDGICVSQICEPNEWTCTGLQTRKQCKEDGLEWNAEESCESDQTCIDGECRDRICVPGSSKCEGNAVVICNNEGMGYSSPIACGENEYCENGVCHSQTCTPGTTECSGNAVIVCNETGSGWSDPTPCAANEFCSNGECTTQVCTPNEKQCADDFNYHICNSNGSAWGDSYYCGDGKYCQNGECENQICTPSERQCTSNSSFRQCNDKGSEWLPEQTCPNDYVCDEGECKSLSDIPDPNIEVSLVRPQPNETKELTQGDSINILVNAVMQGGNITSVDLIVNDTTYATDTDLPYEFPFTVPEDATTGTQFTIIARANGDNNRFNVSEPAYILVRNDMPVAAFTATIAGDRTVAVDASSSSDRETPLDQLEVRWDWENDGIFDTDWSTDKVATHTYSDYTTYTIALEVRDAIGQVNSTTHEITFNDVNYVGGEISADTTWYGTIVITGDVVIPAGVTVSVDPGTRVLFVYQDTQPADSIGDYGITVNGKLNVNGTEENPVLFSSYGSDHRMSGAWEGILLDGENSSISHAIIEYGDACIGINDSSSISNLEVRQCKSWGVKLSGTNAIDNTLDGLNIHSCDGNGLIIQGAPTGWNITNLTSSENGGAGVVLQNVQNQGNISGCEVHHNAKDGFFIYDSSPNIEDCNIHHNGENGVEYRFRDGGTLTHSNITENAFEGIRINVKDSGPQITWNNIYGNSTNGGWKLFTEDTSDVLTWDGPACCNEIRKSDTWTAPNNGTILNVQLTYDENDQTYYNNYVHGGIYDADTNEELWRTIRDVTNYWVEIHEISNSVHSIFVYVYDRGWGDTQSIRADKVTYAIDGQSGIEMSANVYNTTVDAQHNYWGIFPNILDAVTMNEPNAVNLQGFVGVPFDDSWDAGPYKSGTISGNETWTGEIFITGNVTVQSGAALELAAGTDVQFIKHDQNHDGVGDFSLIVDGELRAVGTEDNPIRLTGYGNNPAEDSFTIIDVRGSGAEMDYVDISHGHDNLRIYQTTLDMNHSTVSNARNVGIQLVNTSNGTQISNSTVSECGSHGVYVDGGEASISYLESTHNGGNGIYIKNKHDIQVTDSTFRYNTLAGASISNNLSEISNTNFSYCHFGDNTLQGLEISGNVGGNITYSNISFNHREAIYIHSLNRQTPSIGINYNNIFSNSVDNTLLIESEDTSDVLTWDGPACCNEIRKSDTWTAPNNGTILNVQLTYDENDQTYYNNYVHGGIYDADTNEELWRTIRDVTNYWVEIHEIKNSVHSIFVYVYDRGWGDTQSITGERVIYSHVEAQDGDVAAYSTDSTASINLQHNWWAGSMDPASKISEYPSGLVDYSAFTGTAFSVGPR